MSNAILIQLAGDAPDLIDRVRARLTDAAIREIAACDYGMEYEENLAALTAIARTGTVPVPLGWPPVETLELTRWAKPAATDVEGHLARLFCCAVLVAASADAANRGQVFVEATGESIAALIESTMALGDGFVDAGVGFLADCGAAHHDAGNDEVAAFAGLGLLVLACDGRSRPLTAPQWRELTHFVLAADARARRGDGDYPAESTTEFVLGLTCHDQNHPLWRRLVRASLGTPAPHVPTEAREELSLIASGLVAEPVRLLPRPGGGPASPPPAGPR